MAKIDGLKSILDWMGATKSGRDRMVGCVLSDKRATRRLVSELPADEKRRMLTEMPAEDRVLALPDDALRALSSTGYLSKLPRATRQKVARRLRRPTRH